MSLNKTRKRLIRKYRKLYNSRPIGLKFSTDGGKTFIALGNVVEDYIPEARNINYAKLMQVKYRLVNWVLETLK